MTGISSCSTTATVAAVTVLTGINLLATVGDCTAATTGAGAGDGARLGLSHVVLLVAGW